jgi:Tol biopolymer transport system component
MKRGAALAALTVLLAACAETTEAPPAAPSAAAAPSAPSAPTAPSAPAAPAMPAPKPAGTDLTLPGEKHLRNVRQLTFGGQNAEAYWSWDDKSLVLQITDDRHVEAGTRVCDHIFTLDVASGALARVSDVGRTTCSYFLPGDTRVIYASTRGEGPDCPPEPDRSQGYVWPLYEYEIWKQDLATASKEMIVQSPGYDAEATVAKDGRIVFTSTRSGDLELWVMDGTKGTPRQLTHEPGYDGGAFFSHDGKQIVWRASRPAPGKELDDYRALLAKGFVRPTALEIFVADADGKNVRQVTKNGKANFAPYFTPDDKAILFASNMEDPKGRSFQIWKVNVDGSGLEQITHDPSGFCSFPMFSRDGKRLAFSSNRNGSVPRETNVFVAEWVP